MNISRVAEYGMVAECDSGVWYGIAECDSGVW